MPSDNYLLPSILLQRVLASYAAVGIFEEWALSMKLFDSIVRTPIRRWDAHVQRNRGTLSDGRQEVLKWAHESEILGRIMFVDLLLYDWAVAIFANQTRWL